MKKTKKIILIIITILLFAAAGVLVYQSFRPDKIPAPAQTPTPTENSSQTPSQDPDELSEEDIGEPAIEGTTLPLDKLFITPERQHYESGKLTIIIPRLKYKKTVGNGTGAATLKKGPGLYDYAQLPNEEYANTSIAAHRRKSDFYYLDEMTTGDYFYLIYDGNIYRYIYKESYVVEPDDWDPVFHKGYSLLTLTTCTPIGVSDHRLIVTATLDEFYEYVDDFEYISNDSELSGGA